MPFFYCVPAKQTHIGKWLYRRKLPITTIQPDIYTIQLPCWDNENASFLRKRIQKRVERKLLVHIQQKQGNLILANRLQPIYESTKPWQIQENVKLILLEKLLAFYFQTGNVKPQQVDLHFVCKTCSKETVDIIKQLANQYNSVHIVSEDRVAYTRLADKLYEEHAQLVTVSNHKRKALKQAKWIINYDVPIEELTAYTINRDSILFLMQTQMQEMPIGFCRMVIQDIILEGEEQWEKTIQDMSLNPKDFAIHDLVSSYIYQQVSRKEKQEKIQSLGIQIQGLQGLNGRISKQELRKTCIETIDKIEKLH